MVKSEVVHNRGKRYSDDMESKEGDGHTAAPEH